MRQKIIFFDIDRTLFDAKSFLNDFYLQLASDFRLDDSQISEIKNLYLETKLELGYFSPGNFIQRIDISLPALRGKLDYFFKSQNIEKYLFEDTKVLFSLNEFTLGVISKGDTAYQKLKIEKFTSVLKPDMVYIFPDKIKKLPEVFDKYSSAETYFIDDEEEVLTAAKKVNSEIKTILIDRSGSSENKNADFMINNLFDIITLLNEKTS